MQRSLNFVVALVLLASACLTSFGCHKISPGVGEIEAPPGDPWFADVTGEVGLNFGHDAGATGKYRMPEIVGSGVALFDFDNDGLLDIYLLQNGGPGSSSTNRLYRQLPGGTFVDVSAGSGLDIAGHNMGVAIGDVNNDGWPDVLVTQLGGIKLFLNNGNGTFTDVSKQAGLESPLWATSASFFDYDRDGWLDLIVVNYVDYDPSWPCSGPTGALDYCAPSVFPGTTSKLFRNLGRVEAAEAATEDKPSSRTTSVRFQDVSLASGIGKSTGPGLGVLCADFDGDGWPDIFVANDGQPNYLWINQHDGTFVEEAMLRGVAYNAMGKAEANMGIAWGDADGDGLFDLYVTHLNRETNTLWKQGPRGLFQDKTVPAALSQAHWRGTGFGTLMGDFDQDGALDIAVVNGRVAKDEVLPSELATFWKPYGERNQLFANDGTGRFRDISKSNASFCGSVQVGRGLACGDIDGDGSLDLIMTQVAGPACLFRNVAPHRGHWLLVRAVDPALHRDAYGAEITVHAQGKRWVRWINPGGSYLCSSDPRAHFGLGAVERFESIEVLWPDGKKESFAGGLANRKLELRKGVGQPIPPKADR